MRRFAFVFCLCTGLAHGGGEPPPADPRTLAETHQALSQEILRCKQEYLQASRGLLAEKLRLSRLMAFTYLLVHVGRLSPQTDQQRLSQAYLTLTLRHLLRRSSEGRLQHQKALESAREAFNRLTLEKAILDRRLQEGLEQTGGAS